MTDISNKTLAVIVGIALVVSLVGLFNLPNSIGLLTGLGTTGQARINITENAELNVTTALIDFGNGWIEPPYSTCTLTTSESTGDPRTCWHNVSGSDGSTRGFHIVNVGNVRLNVSVLSVINSSLAFWGVAGGEYKWKCSGNGTSTSLTDYQNVRNDTGAAINCVSFLNATAGQDEFVLDINITIPEAATGVKNDTITFTGSKA